MRIKGSGCKMLDKLPLHEMSRDSIVEHLEKSCCPALKEFGKLL